MFKDNKYSTWYYSIINRAKNRLSDCYNEKHHIIPKSLGGTNHRCNIVSLTAKEHFICHMLLVRMTDGEDRKKMSYALWTMTRSSKNHDRFVTSAQYAIARKHFIEAVKSREVSVETRAKRSASTKGKPRPWAKNSFRNAKRFTKMWSVTHPCGKTETINNLAAFCREYNLSQGNIRGGTKGYKASELV